MDLSCEVCNGQFFYSRDGVTYCTRCNSESRAHGHETVVDEETIGTFQSGMAAALKTSVKKNKRKSKRSRNRRASKYLVSFTSIDAFTFILKGWVDDLVELGAPLSTQETVKLLWCNYLKKIGIPFSHGEDSDAASEISVGNFPSYRDLQTKITGRKKLIAATHLIRNRNQRTKMTKKELKMRKSDSDDVEDADELELRRRRSKKRRKFISSLISEETLTSETDTSRVSADSSHRSDDFNLSYSSMDRTTSGSEADFSFDSGSESLAGSSSEFSSDESNSGLSADEWDEARLEVEMRSLEKLDFKKRMPKGPGYGTLQYPTLKLLFTLLTLGVMMTEENGITLMDLLFWADRNGISFKTCVKHLPDVMKLQSREDVLQFTPSNAELFPLDHFKIRRQISSLGSYLGLKTAIFPTQSLDKIMQRFLKDLSLPAAIFDVVKNSLKNLDLMNVKDYFKTYFHGRIGLAFSSLDLYVLALILFSLKYLYGLDGRSELYRSSDARKFNQDNPTKNQFVICDWIEKSRRRVFLSLRFSDDLHKKFTDLFPHVQRSSATLRQSFVNLTTTCKKMQQTTVKEKGDISAAPNVQAHLCLKNDPVRLEAVSDFITKSFERSTRELKANTLDLSKSWTPLLDMSNHFISIKDNIDCELDSDEIQVLADLLQMGSSTIGLDTSHQDSQEVEVEGDWVCDYIRPPQEGRNKCQIAYSKNPEPLPEVQHAAYYRFDAPYWRLSWQRWSSDISKLRKSPASEDLVSSLPENFAWILKYFAAYSCANPIDIYHELVRIETEIYKSDPKFFGIGLRSVAANSDHPGLWNRAFIRL